MARHKRTCLCECRRRQDAYDVFNFTIMWASVNGTTSCSWDSRSPTEPKTKIQAHEREILAVAFSPATEHLIVTGSADKTAVLHDLRSPTKKLHTFESHTDEVLHLAWSPHNPTIFASASSDRRVNIWDLSLIGQEQTPDDQEDGPPELLFVHGGKLTKWSVVHLKLRCSSLF